MKPIALERRTRVLGPLLAAVAMLAGSACNRAPAPSEQPQQPANAIPPTSDRDPSQQPPPPHAAPAPTQGTEPPATHPDDTRQPPPDNPRP